MRDLNRREEIKREEYVVKKCSNKIIATSILWASAILASALLDAPQFLTLVLLPTLAIMSVFILSKKSAE